MMNDQTAYCFDFAYCLLFEELYILKYLSVPCEERTLCPDRMKEHFRLIYLEREPGE